jgi:hypothetical protein
MATPKEKLKQAVKELLLEGRQVSGADVLEEDPGLNNKLVGKSKSAKRLKMESRLRKMEMEARALSPPRDEYQAWYSKALPVVRQIAGAIPRIRRSI